MNNNPTGPDEFPNLWTTTYYSKFPYKCPVCEGKMFLPPGLYTCFGETFTTNGEPEPCRTCEKGIVWN